MGMQADIFRWCKECIPCQMSKVTKHTVPKLREIPVPSRRFTEVNLDILGPLSPSQGFRYLLTMSDRNTRWLEVTELDDISASHADVNLQESCGPQCVRNYTFSTGP